MTTTAKKTGAPRIAVLNCSWFQGNLYTVMGEDELLYVADTFFTALGVDGVVYVLDTYRIAGHFTDDEGHERPDRNYREQAEAFVQRVERRGLIDAARWSPWTPETCEEREAWNARCEYEDEHGIGSAP